MSDQYAPTILLTRDGDAPERFREALETYAAPHINILTFSPLYTYNCDIPPLSSTDFDKIIVSSERAIPWLKANLNKLSGVKILCVGTHLAKQITACGYFCAQTYPQMEFLLKDEAMYVGAKILYVRGLHIRHDLEEMIAPKASHYEEVTVYKARERETLPADIQGAIRSGQIRYVSVFSARAGEALVRLIRTSRLEAACTRIQCLCLSPVVLKSVGSLDWHQAYAASTADMDGMAKLAADVLE